MTTSPAFSDSDIFENKDRLVGIRKRIRDLFLAGATGLQIATLLCDLTDELLIEIIRKSLYESQTFSIKGHRLVHDRAVIAIGGYGRGELAPYSDIDVLFLTRSSKDDEFDEIVSRIVRDCWDSGCKLGHGLRSLSETIALARTDSQVATSLTEMRLLWGSASLLRDLKTQFSRQVSNSRSQAFIEDCVRARQLEQMEYGATVNALEPDVKRSKGGLRDLQLIRWVGTSVKGVANFESLRLKGSLMKDESRALRDAHDFLTHVRIDLHLQAGRANDLLNREEQLRIADERGLKDIPGRRAVEQFMQTYFQHTTAVSQICERFLHRCHSASLARKFADFMMSYRLDGKFVVGNERIRIFSSALGEVTKSIQTVVQFFNTASMLNVLPHPDTEDAIYSRLHEMNRTVDQLTTKAFCQILARPEFLSPLLRSMFKCGILDIVIPQFAHARGLLQFNQYHSYTVDEHTLKTIEAIEKFHTEDSFLGRTYRQIQRKEILHLALLLHDLGKGMPGDHSDVGANIAREVANRLDLSETQRDELIFLVQYHLQMTHLAFRRDISDPKVVIEFAHLVGSPDLLKKLFMMTVADIQGVGPTAWTSWKEELLVQLLQSTLQQLSGGDPGHDELSAVEQFWSDIKYSKIWEDVDEQWLKQRRLIVTTMPTHYLTSIPVEKIASDIEIIERLDQDAILVDYLFERDAEVIEFRVISTGGKATGIFQRIVGVLTAHQLQVIGAEIATLPDGTFIDRFQVLESSFDQYDLQSQIEKIQNTIQTVIRQPLSMEKLFQKHQRFQTGSDILSVSNLPIRVSIDNDSSEELTIIDVFAHDRTGLLFTITKCLEEMELSVAMAKIATHSDQVVDVFYVTDNKGEKITDPLWLKSIREKLERRINEFDQHGYRLFSR